MKTMETLPDIGLRVKLIERTYLRQRRYMQPLSG
jgi:hypothetical protein